MEKKYYLNFLDAYLDDEYLYAVNSENNIFFRARRDKDYSVEILGVINKFWNVAAEKICAVQYYNDSLYMFSNCTYGVARYDLGTRALSYYHPDVDKETFGIVCGVCRGGDDGWILRDSFSEELCVFSLGDCRYNFYDLDISVLSDLVKKEKRVHMTKENIYLVGNKVWRYIPGTNYLYTIDIVTKQLEIHRVACDIQICAFNHDEEGFCLISLFGECIVQWDESRGVISKKKVRGEERIGIFFQGIIHVNGGYLLLPGLADTIYFSPKEEEKIRKCDLPPQFHRKEGRRGLFLNYFLDGSKLLLFPVGGNGLVEVDTDTLETVYYPVYASKEECIRMLVDKKWNISESRELALDSYISLIDGSLTTCEKVCSDTVGRQIYESSRGNV